MEKRYNDCCDMNEVLTKFIDDIQESMEKYKGRAEYLQINNAILHKQLGDLEKVVEDLNRNQAEMIMRSSPPGFSPRRRRRVDILNLEGTRRSSPMPPCSTLRGAYSPRRVRSSSPRPPLIGRKTSHVQIPSPGDEEEVEETDIKALANRRSPPEPDYNLMITNLTGIDFDQTEPHIDLSTVQTISELNHLKIIHPTVAKAKNKFKVRVPKWLKCSLPEETEEDISGNKHEIPSPQSRSPTPALAWEQQDEPEPAKNYKSYSEGDSSEPDEESRIEDVAKNGDVNIAIKAVETVSVRIIDITKNHSSPAGDKMDKVKVTDLNYDFNLPSITNVPAELSRHHEPANIPKAEVIRRDGNHTCKAGYAAPIDTNFRFIQQEIRRSRIPRMIQASPAPPPVPAPAPVQADEKKCVKKRKGSTVVSPLPKVFSFKPTTDMSTTGTTGARIPSPLKDSGHISTRKAPLPPLKATKSAKLVTKSLTPVVLKELKPVTKSSTLSSLSPSSNMSAQDVAKLFAARGIHFPSPPEKCETQRPKPTRPRSVKPMKIADVYALGVTSSTVHMPNPPSSESRVKRCRSVKPGIFPAQVLPDVTKIAYTISHTSPEAVHKPPERRVCCPKENTSPESATPSPMRELEMSPEKKGKSCTFENFPHTIINMGTTDSAPQIRKSPNRLPHKQKLPMRTSITAMNKTPESEANPSIPGVLPKIIGSQKRLNDTPERSLSIARVGVLPNKLNFPPNYPKPPTPSPQKRVCGKAHLSPSPGGKERMRTPPTNRSKSLPCVVELSLEITKP